MKNLKISLTAIVTAIILTISTGVYASDRAAIFDDQVIKMPSALSNGKGVVSTSTLSGASLSYQFVLDGINASAIAKIQRYEEEIAIAKAYNTYTANMIDSTDASDTNLQKYQSLLNAYKAKYYAGVTDENAIISVDGTTRLASSTGLTQERIDIWESAIETLYGARGSNWTESSDGKTVEFDLSTISGTHYVVLWARYTKNGANQYRPQWYKVTGTANTKQTDNTVTDNTTTVDNTTTGGTSTSSGSTTTGSASKDTTASTTGQTLPKTGVGSTILGLIAVAGTSAGYSFRKYRKIK